jgi:UDP-3-O-[3-hydroxymyristoyl] glucosamine N-acyltransferase
MGADARFYTVASGMRLSQLFDGLSFELTKEQAEAVISDAAPFHDAADQTVSFLLDPARSTSLATRKPTELPVNLSKRSVVLADSGAIAWLQAFGADCMMIETPSPKAHFSKLAEKIITVRPLTDGAHPISPSARVHPTAFIAPHVTIGADCVIGEGARIDPYTLIGTGCVIGPHTHVAGHAHIAFAEIGAHCQILPGARIGTDGFGTAALDGRHIPIAHFGRVIIEDHVTIGANTTVDRGMFEPTLIGEGTRIDNLVQIAHNVRIGRDCLIAGCVGISGSCTIGDNVVLGGSVGIADHVNIGDGAMLAGATLVMRDVPPGETWAGTPARPIKQFFREVAALNRLATRRQARGSHDQSE